MQVWCGGWVWESIVEASPFRVRDCGASGVHVGGPCGILLGQGSTAVVDRSWIVCRGLRSGKSNLVLVVNFRVGFEERASWRNGVGE